MMNNLYSLKATQTILCSVKLKKGERVHDKSINRLTVVANESYEDFARSLQNEFEQDAGIRFGILKPICFANIMRDQNGSEVVLGQETSKAIWNNLLVAGYINESGEIQNSFDPNNPNFDLKIDEQYAGIKSAIIDEIQRYIFKHRVVNVRDRQRLQFNKQVSLSPEFVALWDKIKYRTRYRVTFDTNDLIKHAVKRIKALDKVKPVKIAVTKVEVELSEAGISTDRRREEKTYQTGSINVLPDLLAYLQKETELTRHTLVEILQQSGKEDDDDYLAEFKLNPQQFMTAIAKEVTSALHDLMLEGIQYEKIANHYWEMSRIEQETEEGIVRYLSSLYKVQNQEKSLFDRIEFDSEVEKQFAQDLDNNEHVRLFVKLPNWFKIDTPIGPYNPDWAFVTKRDKKLYFVRETKSTKDKEALRIREKQKIACGKSHFDTIGVDYEVVTKLSEVSF